MKKQAYIYKPLVVLFLFLVNAQPSMADSNITMQAATGCFPRVFSQIDFFKSSNGGLRNDSGTAKTVVCSIHVNDFEGIESDSDLDARLQVYPYFAFNFDQEDINCTAYLRGTETGNGTAFQESYTMDTLTLVAGWSDGGGNSLMQLDIITNGDAYDSYQYFQCTLPAGVAITKYNIYNN